MTLKRHDNAETGRALAWQPCLGASFGLTACPNAPSRLRLQFVNTNGIGRLKSAEQQFSDYRRMRQ
jgi:hypothetical protein